MRWYIPQLIFLLLKWLHHYDAAISLIFFFIFLVDFFGSIVKVMTRQVFTRNLYAANRIMLLDTIPIHTAMPANTAPRMRMVRMMIPMKLNTAPAIVIAVAIMVFLLF